MWLLSGGWYPDPLAQPFSGKEGRNGKLFGWMKHFILCEHVCVWASKGRDVEKFTATEMSLKGHLWQNVAPPESVLHKQNFIYLHF